MIIPRLHGYAIDRMSALGCLARELERPKSRRVRTYNPRGQLAAQTANIAVVRTTCGDRRLLPSGKLRGQWQVSCGVRTFGFQRQKGRSCHSQYVIGIHTRRQESDC